MNPLDQTEATQRQNALRARRALGALVAVSETGGADPLVRLAIRETALGVKNALKDALPKAFTVDEYTRAATDPVGYIMKLNSADPKHVAEEILKHEDSSGTACLAAAEYILGDHIYGWEPETIWLELERRDIELPDVNHDKILAAMTLKMVPAFAWDAHVFENTCMAFNGHLSDPDVFHEAEPEYMAWAVADAEFLLGEKIVFDYEPAGYVATVLHRAGFVLAPATLSFAQEQLDRLNQNKELVKAVNPAWEKYRVGDTLTESLVDIQVHRLAAVKAYVDQRQATLEDEIKAMLRSRV